MIRPLRLLSRLGRRVIKETRGVAVTETALMLPFFLGAGLYGIELANYSLTKMKVGQLATHIADNASRIGDTSTLENRKIYESDINDLLLGASIQAGNGMDIYKHGRVILSSLEVNTDGKQYIHWQRCQGSLEVSSSFGKEGKILRNGMGYKGQKVLAMDGDAVAFVEIQYEYQPLVSKSLIGEPQIESTASYNVRASRDLSQIYQLDASKPATVHDCATYSES